MKTDGKQWKMMKKRWKTIENDERRWKMLKNDEKITFFKVFRRFFQDFRRLRLILKIWVWAQKWKVLKCIVKKIENQWKTMKNDEKTMKKRWKNDEKRLKTIKNDWKRWKRMKKRWQM